MINFKKIKENALTNFETFKKSKKVSNWTTLMWKNYVLQWRHLVRTIAEISFYFLVTGAIIALDSSIKSSHAEDEGNEMLIPDLYEFHLYPPPGHKHMGGKLLYAPYTTELRTIMECFSTHFTLFGFNNEEEMYEYYNNDPNQTVFAAMNFSSGDFNAEKIQIVIRFPGDLRYSIKNDSWMTNQFFAKDDSARGCLDQFGCDPGYFDEGFLSLQYFSSVLIMNREYIGDLCSVNPMEVFDLMSVRVLMKRFPEALSFTLTNDFSALLYISTYATSFTYMFSFLNIIKSLVMEKQTQLKETMKILGLSNTTHWTAWYCKSFSFLMIPTVFLIMFLKIFDVFGNSSFLVLFFFFALYVSATITLSFAVSVFFSKGVQASFTGVLLWIVSLVPHGIYRWKPTSLGTLLFCNLLSNTALCFGYDLIFTFEKIEEGVQWDNLTEPPTGENKVTMIMIMGMLLLDTVVYMLIALYIEAVFPGEQGVPLPWYFPFSPHFWIGGAPTNIVVQQKKTKHHERNPEFFEGEPANLKPGVQICNLRKVFQKAVAVSDLSFNMYEDQITVLLGHNGAGKSTSINLLIGMLKPTSGTAIVYGYDIRTDLAQVRKYLGFCLQHDIILDEMTVQENLYFFAKLRGIPDDEVEAEVTKFITLLDLTAKAGSNAGTLSGGQKRKLSVGVALCGNAKFILLDEPTAGMDPSARRFLWDLLKEQKTGRTILLTTHFMDEADYLGDRIAIMAQGKLQCCGSPFFLKKKLGSGYHLVMVKDENCDVNKVTELLRKYVDNVKLNSNIGSELSYILPEDHLPTFKKAFKKLEEEGSRLGIKSFGISLTTMEEVFLKAGKHRSFPQEQKQKTTRVNDRTKLEKKMKKMNIYSQILSMILKRVWFMWRNPIFFVLHFTIPFLFGMASLSRGFIVIDDLPELVLNLEKVKDSITLIQGSNLYSDVFEDTVGAHSTIEKVDNLEQEFLRRLEETPMDVTHHYLIGALFSSDEEGIPQIITYFNNIIYHSDGIALAYVLNAISSTDNDVALEFINKPFPFRNHIKQLADSGEDSPAATVIMKMMIVSIAYLITYYIKERSTEFKHLQFLAGVNSYVFWITAFVIDFVLLLAFCSEILLLLLYKQIDGYVTAEEMGRIFFILVLFICQVLPVIYVFSSFFTREISGYIAIILIGCICELSYYAVSMFMVDKDLKHIFKFIHMVHNIVPFYTLLANMKDTYAMYKRRHYRNDKKVPVKMPIYYYQWESPGIARYIAFIIVQSTCLCLFLILNEKNFFAVPWAAFQNRVSKFYRLRARTPYDKDDDVTAEREKIMNTPHEKLCEEHVLVLRDVTKYFGFFPAVYSVCLGVKHFECFGLLGVNGAGKTTTFKMMAALIQMTSGDIWMNGANIKLEYSKASKVIGYCPQFNGLLEDLTPKETLIIFGLIHGLTWARSKRLATLMAADFDFTNHLNKKVNQLSGGNKRKLSAAVACMGNPLVLFLDEPTTGMDVATKRFLWNILIENRESGKSIILTSHSMEECEALCTRLTIMVNGELRCLGSTQHLKDKFSAGYILTIKPKKYSKMETLEILDNIETFILKKFPTAVLNDKHEELITFYLKDVTLKLSKMFSILQKAKRKRHLFIEDYSLGQGSLEQVFLMFTKFQK